jgi:hypothetical protein
MNHSKVKSLLLLSASLWSLNTKAQIEKGTLFVGGRSSFGTTNSSISNPFGSSDSKGTNFSIVPQAGYYVNKNWAFGLGFTFNSVNGTENSLNVVTADYRKVKNQKKDFGFNLLARYNKALSKRFAFFVHSNLSTSLMSKEKITLDESRGSIKVDTTTINEGRFGQSPNFKLEIQPGITYFITPKFGIDATFASVFVNYSSTKATASNQNTKSSNFNLGYYFQPSNFWLGVHYYFAPKPKKQVVEEME